MRCLRDSLIFIPVVNLQRTGIFFALPSGKQEGNMGFIDSITIASALPSSALVLGSGWAVWLSLMAVLGAATIGILSAVPRPRRAPQQRRLVRMAEAV